jgi:hypothetical protein
MPRSNQAISEANVDGHTVRWLSLFVMFAAILSSDAQTSPSGEKTSELAAELSRGGHFPAMLMKSHSIFTQSALRPAWQVNFGGELIVSNGSIQFSDPQDAKSSFTVQVRDVSSLERRYGPGGFRVLRIKLQNGKKFDLVPDTFSQPSGAGESGKNATEKAMDEGVNAMEKAIRNMASELGIVLK